MRQFEKENSCFHLLYQSRISENCSSGVFSDVCQQSRHRNSALGIRSVLIFDGDRFCQLLMGDKDPVHRLSSKISADKRHRDFTVLVEAEKPTQASTDAWLAGFCGVEELIALGMVRGDAALEAFNALLPRAYLFP